MKKTRITALLMAAAMAVTSLPIVTSASSAGENMTPYNENLLDASISTSASGWQTGDGYLTATPVTATNTYLRTNDVSNATAQAFFVKLDASYFKGENDTYGVKEDTTYTVELYMRAQIDSGSMKVRVIDQNNAWRKVCENNFDSTGFNWGNVTNTWKYYKYPVTANSNSNVFQIGFIGGGGFADIAPLEIDNITISTGSGDSLKTHTYTFENGLDTAAGESWTCNNTNASASVVTETTYIHVGAVAEKDNIAAVEAAVEAGEYSKAAVNKVSEVLTPGKYELTFDARMSCFFKNTYHNDAEYAYEASRGNKKPVLGTNTYVTEATLDTDGERQMVVDAINYSTENNDFVTDKNAYYHIMYKRGMGKNSSGNIVFSAGHACYHTNYRDIRVNLGAGTTTLATADMRVTDDWESYKVTFVVDEKTTLDSISFGGTGLAYDNDAFDLANISLKLVEIYDYNLPTVEGTLLEGVAPAVGTVTTVPANPDSYGKDGYMSVDTRDWIYSNPSATDYRDVWAVNWLIWQINTGATVEKDENITYYIQFDARSSVPSNENQVFIISLFGQEVKTTTLTSNSEWSTYTASVSGNNTSNSNVFVRRSKDPATSRNNIPLDFDNLIIWKDNGDGVYTSADGDPVYSQSFDGTMPSVVSGGITPTQKFEGAYSQIAADTLAYTNLNALNNGEGCPAGVYTFTADLRLPYFHYTDLSETVGKADETVTDTTTWANETIAAWKASNDHEVVVNFTQTPTDGGEAVVKAVKGTVNYNWSTLTAGVVVNDGCKLTSVEVVPDFGKNPTKVIDFNNVSLTYDGGLPTVDGAGSNFLDGTVPSYDDNTVPADQGSDGYLYVSERITNDSWGLFQFNTGAAVTAGEEYIVEFDFTAYSIGKEVGIRPRVNVNTSTRVSGYLDSADNNDFTEEQRGGWTQFTTTSFGQKQTFRGKFTPTASINGLVLYIHKTDDANDVSPFAVDNVKIYRASDEVEIYSNDFNSRGDIHSVYVWPQVTDANCTIEHIIPKSNTVVTPSDPSKSMTVTYPVTLTSSQAVEGKYSFSTMARIVSGTAQSGTGYIVFNYEDGTSTQKEVEITSSWTTISYTKMLEGDAKLVSIALVFDCGAAVEVMDPALNIRDKYADYNFGIIMVLLKKKQAMIEAEKNDPWKQIGIE